MIIGDAQKSAVDSTATMIAPDREFGSAPILRRFVTCEQGHGRVVSAELLATALGVVEVSINGEVVSPDLLTPGWSSYEWRLRYATWDVTDLIAPEMVIGAILGRGWHSGRLGFAGGRALYGDVRAALLELRISFEDGHVQTIVSDNSWQSGPSEIVADDLYDGETIDRRRLTADWLQPCPAPDGWSGVIPIEFDRNRLVPYIAPPIRRQEELTPQQVWVSPAGAILADFGQNFVGWVRLNGPARAGTEIALRHAEVLEHGEIGVRPLRTAAATDRFILGKEATTFEPRFTFHGFRYVEITGWPGSIDELKDAMTGVVIGSDLVRIGRFECSNPLLNQLHSNIVWGMRGNFVDVPTDCPQRDERLGWTGDLAAFVRTAVFLYDVGGFLHDWLSDLAVEQEHGDGMIPLVVPDNFKLENRYGMTEQLREIPNSIAALWHDAAAWVPWASWQAYGDRAALIDAYPSMASYGRRIARATEEDGLLGGLQFGDWLDPDAPPDNPRTAKADSSVVATACVYRSICVIRDAAQALDRTEDIAEFDSVAARIREAFNRNFVADGRITSDAPTVYALAIVFGLLNDSDRWAAGDRLSTLVREADHHITTGFAGTPFITWALSETDHLDDAYGLLLQTSIPSWLYPVTMGATTVWERWDSMLPDGSINSGEMTSFNHYAFGAVGDWMHAVVGGLSSIAPGYRVIRISPRPGGDLSWARTTLETPGGRASVEWWLDKDTLTVEADIPQGSTAIVSIPGVPDSSVNAGLHRFVAPYSSARPN